MNDQGIMAGYQPYDPRTIRLAGSPLIPRLASDLRTDKTTTSLSKLFDEIGISDHMTLSFHHHLRDGDGVMNMVFAEIRKRGLKAMRIAPSALFPVHAPLVDLIKEGMVTDIVTNYINGPVAECVADGLLQGSIIMDTHGGRARAIETGELTIDVAFIAASAADVFGNANGIDGKNPCGTLGYVIPDLKYAKHRVIVTDTLLDQVTVNDLDGAYVDHVLVIPSIGNADHIRSGTTRPTRDPIQLVIAHNTAQVIDALSLIKEGMTFQTGAGGISLAVAQDIGHLMTKRKVTGRFASGGITSFLVDMFEKGLFETLYDVQCFDPEAVASYRRNPNHRMMDAAMYASPLHPRPIAYQLDTVVLGASEIDLDFNVNVTTDSANLLIGGSGGHADTAYGAAVSLVTTSLLKGRIPVIRDLVTTITTPGATVDILVTERGIAVNPLRTDLLERLGKTNLDIVTITTLMQRAQQMTGIPNNPLPHGRPIGLVRYFDGSITDIIRARK